MKMYRIGILGFGFIGKVHACCHANLPFYYDQQEFGSKITGVCTAHPESARKAAAVLGDQVRAVTDFRELMENPDVDIIHICTPNDRHCDALLSAMAHQKHIYCDKPLTATSAEAQKIRDALPQYRGISQMTLQTRFFPTVLRAKQLITEGRIGEILEFHGRHLHSGSSDPNAPLKWKLQAGTVADLGSHILDLMQFLTGDFASVSAATHIAYPDRPAWGEPGVRKSVTAEDNMIAAIRLKNGAAGTVCASKIATGTEDEISFEIHGTKGALRIAPLDLHHLYFYDSSAPDAPVGGTRGWTAIDCGQRYEPPAGFPTAKSPLGWMRGHLHCLYNFMNAVHTGQNTAPSIADGIRLQFLLEKVKESAAKRCWVDLQEK